MDEIPSKEAAQSFPVDDDSAETNRPLTIKILGSPVENGERSVPISPSISISISPHLNSPSPPSSAFVSALQSPYISPRALDPATENSTVPSAAARLPIQHSGSHINDIPSTSYTHPSESYDFVIDQIDVRRAFTDALPPRASFSFPVPRISFTKATVSPSSNAKLRTCDVYIGFHGQNKNLARFCKWLKSELELQGIASFVADRAKYSDNHSHEIADRIICSVNFGVVVVTPSSFLNPLSVEEIRFFSQKKNLVPLLFDTELLEIKSLCHNDNMDMKDCMEAYECLNKCNEVKLEANQSNWRSCVAKAVGILKSKLGRKSIAVKEIEAFEEFPFPRNRQFIGREKELAQIETAFFGCCDVEYSKTAASTGGQSEGIANEESDTTVIINGRCLSMDLRKVEEPTLETWSEPGVELARKGKKLRKQRLKHKNPQNAAGKRSHCNPSVFCITGPSGIGKTELALEFSYRFSQRYKKVLWVGGEARYFRQNILNLSISLGLDVSAEGEKECGTTRSFDEQELDAFQRVKRELFRDVPYLLVINNIESENEWWDGKDLYDLIPRNTDATHVIITTRLPKIMSFEPMQLQEFSLADSLLLMKGKSKRDFSAEDLEMLEKLDEKLGRLSFGLSLIGCILSETDITPSELSEAIQMIFLNNSNSFASASDEGFWRNNSYLIRVLTFCFVLIDRAQGKNLASQMALAGAWFASAPVSSVLLAAAVDKLPTKENNSFHHWGKTMSMALFCGSRCFLAPQARRIESDAALLLVKLGLARRATRSPGIWIQFHSITQMFAKRRGGLQPAKAAVHAVRKIGNPAMNADHLWASAFLVFGFKSEPPAVQLKAVDMILFIKRTAIPLAVRSFMMFSRCNSALELLKVCTNVLEEVEQSFVSQIQESDRGSFCWKKKLQSRKVDEFVWQEVTLLKATLLETRAKLLLRGGLFDYGEELCRTCISIRTVMLGHNHAQTLAAQETLARLVRCRSKI